MTTDAPADLDARLRRAAADFVIAAGGPPIEQVVLLAEKLVAAGFGGDATVEVAALRRDAARRDAEPLVREMLAEHGFDLPAPEDDDAKFQLLLKAFGYWNLPVGDFSSAFWRRLPSWDEQDDLDRALTVLFDDLDRATNPADKAEVVDRMRAVVRSR